MGCPRLRAIAATAELVGSLIHYDRRGTGLSDPVPLDQLPDLQTQVGDAVAVLKAARSDSAAVIGLNDGTIAAVLLAAAHPELCRSLVLFTLTSAHTLAAGLPMESIEEVLEMLQANAVTDESGVQFLAPSRVGDERFDQQLARLQRFSVRPRAWAHYYRQTMKADVADVLPLIRTPTLVLNRTGNPIVPVEQSRVAAAAIKGARFVELPGTDHLAFSEGIDSLVDELEEFLTGTRTGADPDRMLTTLLFTDIVNSTTLAAQLGDRRCRDLLDQHPPARPRRAGPLRRPGGRNHRGRLLRILRPSDRGGAVRPCHGRSDGVAAAPDPRRRPYRRGRSTRGGPGRLAVHIAARIAALAGDGEVLVSSTVKDLLVGANIGFDDRQAHELKGVPGTWRLFTATPSQPH